MSIFSYHLYYFDTLIRLTFDCCCLQFILLRYTMNTDYLLPLFCELFCRWDCFAISPYCTAAYLLHFGQYKMVFLFFTVPHTFSKNNANVSRFWWLLQHFLLLGVPSPDQDFRGIFSHQAYLKLSFVFFVSLCLIACVSIVVLSKWSTVVSGLIWSELTIQKVVYVQYQLQDFAEIVVLMVVFHQLNTAKQEAAVFYSPVLYSACNLSSHLSPFATVHSTLKDLLSHHLQFDSTFDTRHNILQS